jgi:VCBS repeat-containing protein
VSATNALLLADDGQTRLYFRPAADYNGAIASALTLRAWDQTTGTAGSKVAISGSAFSSADDTVAVTVTAVNDAPTGSDATISLVEDGSHTFAAADFGFGDATDGGSNSGADALSSVTISTLPSLGTLTLDAVAVNAGDVISAADIAAGKLVYTPVANGNGSAYASFTFVVQDNGGTANGGVDSDPVANTITFNISAVADAATFGSGAGVDTGSVTEDLNVSGGLVSDSGTLTVSDPDAGQAAFNAGTFAGSYGSLTIDAAGAWSYAASNSQSAVQALGAGQSMTDTVAVTSVDGSSHTITITIHGANDAPTIGNPSNPDWDAANGRYSVSTPEDTPRSGSIDTADVDGNTLSFAASTAPSHGSVSVDPATGAWVYTPAANFNGSDSFVVTVSDGHGGSTTVTMAVEVTPVNDLPSFGTLDPADTRFTTGQDSPWTGHLPSATDGDDATLTYSVAEGPAHGTVVIDPDGHYRYVPAAGFHGSDSFLAQVSDGHGGTATLRIDVDVLAAPTMRLPAESDLGVSNSDRVTSADAITLTGQAQPGQTLHLYAPDGHLLATVVANGSGIWRADGVPMALLQGDNGQAATGAAGVYTFTLKPVQTDGQDGAAVRLSVTRELPPTPQPESKPAPTEPTEPTKVVTPAPAALPEAPKAFDSALGRPPEQVQDAGQTQRLNVPTVPTATDGDIYTRPSGFRIMVTPSTEPSLKLYRGVDDQVVPAGRTLIVQVPADAFVHTQINETISLTATLANGQPLPGWLVFDGKSGKFVGQPPNGVLQDLAIKVTARDSQGRQATTMFRIKTGDGAITPSRSPLSLQLMRREALALDRAGQPGRADAPAAWKAMGRSAAARG